MVHIGADIARRGETALVVERVISLGGLCQTTYQIRTRFGFHIGSPFDWLVTSLSAVKTILRTDGTRFGMAVHCQTDGPAAICKGHTVFCSEYGVAYQHEFGRDDRGRAIVSDDALAQCRGKLMHKYQRMQQTLLQNRPTLFIRLAGHHDDPWLTPNVDDPRPVLASELNELDDIIAAKYPELPFVIAFVCLGSRTTLRDAAALHRRIVLIRLDETVEDWFGDKREWDKVFRRFDFDLGTAEHAEKEDLL